MEIVPIFQFFKKCPRLQYDFKNSLDLGGRKDTNISYRALRKK